VTQRLKRFESIEAKLVRSQTRLGEMEDIAGCRTVLPGLDSVARVHEQLAQAARKLEVVTVRDYCERPHPGGYRALHLWCRRNGFKIEIQLRTNRQQRWAEMVEEWDSALRLDLKHEVGPDVVLNYFRLLADYYFSLDSGVANSHLDVSPLKAAEDELVTWLRGVDHG
jgi:ppGpp synthetase/RelA/SpoT-type nucleotidyltranferase